MTDFQMKQIREFRMKGVGYRAIGSVVGLSRDVVRNYCKTHGLDGIASELTMNLKEQIQQGLVCLSCGKELKQPDTGRKKKFCTDNCRRQWWVEHSDSIQRKETSFYEKTCVYCNKDFKVYGNKNRKYCSHNCYVHDRFWRKEEGRERYIGPSESIEVNNE